MNDPRINLLEEHFRLERTEKPSPWHMGRYFFGAIVVGAFVGIGFSYAATHANLASDNLSGGFLGSVASFATSGERSLEGENSDRVNFLILGVGGEGHDGPELADTIMFASFKPSDKSIGVLSIPRDLTVPIPGYGWRKINHANAFGESEKKGNGVELATKTIETLLKQKINYAVKVDFGGFEKIIDAVDGVDVFVERAFSDSQYPTDDFLTRTVSFQAGWQHMGGKTALEFVRSRHGTNGEGSDFARAKRQQLVLLALRDRMLSGRTLFNPLRLTEIWRAASDNVSTNLSTWETLRLASLFGDASFDNIRNGVLGIGNGQPLMETTVNGAYVLLPRDEDWSEIRDIAANLLSDSTKTASIISSPQKQVRISIQNGTEINGLAFRASQLLEGQGFEVVSVSNANARDVTKTVIYDLTKGKNDGSLESLKRFLDADISSENSGWIFETAEPKELTVESEGIRTGNDVAVDFLVILGTNASSLVRSSE
ncbi:MAG: LCP family protein [Patescibacteria group bacterium]